MDSQITRIDEVQERVGKLPGPRDMKVIDFLDAHALRWLSLSSFCILVLRDAGAPMMTAAGGNAGFMTAPTERQIDLSLDCVDDTAVLHPGASFGALFFLSGMTETLRINGRVDRVTDGVAALTVQECYLHCGKALLRSDFWAPVEGVGNAGTIEDAIQQSRLLALGTVDADGNADVSPKGDPAGRLLHKKENAVWYPDRPGNRRIDSFRNILAQPQVALLALVPGSASMLYITGEAVISDDLEQRQVFAVKDKLPTLVTRVAISHAALQQSQALARAKLWPTQPAPEGLRAADIFRDHMKLSKEKGLDARVARAAVSVPGLLKRGLESDYEKNMY
ncbi:MAG: pyridoxamine 5'-phosphate oxidase family protein [Pseudomonadota bacterium]